jgi:hypothetical protein
MSNKLPLSRIPLLGDAASPRSGRRHESIWREVGHVLQRGGVLGQEELLEDEPDSGGAPVSAGHGEFGPHDAGTTTRLRR